MQLSLTLTKHKGETVAFGRNVAVKKAIEQAYKDGLHALCVNDPFAGHKPCFHTTVQGSMFDSILTLALGGAR